MWKITNKSDNEAEIFLYDEISSYNDDEIGLINAKGLIKQIQSLGDINVITLRINSTGGDVCQAQAMSSYLKSCKADIIVKIDGIAASAASLVAMAGDKIIMPENAMMMIHNPAGGVLGEAEDMREMAEILDKIRDIIASIYEAKTGLTQEKITELMNAETWMTAHEALELKFCDEVIPNIEIAASVGKNGILLKNVIGSARIDNSLGDKIPKDFINTQTFKEDTKMQITNLTELEAAYPELVSEIKNSAVNSERERLKILDNLNAEGCEEIINKAKYEEPRDPRDVAIDIVNAMRNSAAIKARYSDADVINEVVIPQRDLSNKKADEEAEILAMASEINRMRGIK